MWSAPQKKVIRLEISLRPCSIQHNYQGQWLGRQLLSHTSPRWIHRSSQLIRIPMNPQFHMGLAVNIQLCLPTSVISTCLPTHLMFWLLWPRFERMKSTAPNHRSHPSCLQFRCPQWMWVPLKARRQHTQQRTTLHFILTMSPDESIRIFLQPTPLTPMSQETYLSLRALPPHHHLHEDKKGSWAWESLFPKGRSVAAHLRGMRPAPTSQKDTVTLRENSNNTYLYSNSNYHNNMFF